MPCLLSRWGTCLGWTSHIACLVCLVPFGLFYMWWCTLALGTYHRAFVHFGESGGGLALIEVWMWALLHFNALLLLKLTRATQWTRWVYPPSDLESRAEGDLEVVFFWPWACVERNQWWFGWSLIMTCPSSHGRGRCQWSCDRLEGIQWWHAWAAIVKDVGPESNVCWFVVREKYCTMADKLGW